MRKKHDDINMSRYAGFILSVFCFSALNAQDQGAAGIIRKVADHVISNTSFGFIDSRTKVRYTNLDSLASSTEVRVESKYNKWEYANGVLMIGMMQAAKVLKEEKYSEFPSRNFDFIFNNLHYFKQSYAVNPRTEWAAFFRMGSLDDCGAMAAALADVNEHSLRKEYGDYLQRAADMMLNKQLRLKDGAFSRTVPRNMTLWADDLYMSVPFLARMGNFTGERKYFDDAINQVRKFNKYLYDSSSGLYFHCWYSDVQQNGVAHWLRCNGWMAMAQVELLSHLPASHPARDELIRLLLRQVIGFSRFQDSTGLWHQIIDRPDSYLETSGTAMFIYAVAKAVNRGWIPSSYRTIALDGWNGLTSKITATGEIEDVCVGTGVSDNIGFYYNRPKVLNDFHATGAVLLAGTEIITLRLRSENKK